MDLFGPTRTLSLNGKRFGLILVDDYSRFSWVFFIFHKNKVKLEGQRINDVYVIDLNSSRNKNIYLMANKDTMTWQ